MKEKKLELVDKDGDTHSYRGWLNSDSFTRRAFAVYGYAISAYLMMVGLFLIGYIGMAGIAFVFGAI